jgi:CheY-like chemotaxis protein/signal transduction histidine kinase
MTLFKISKSLNHSEMASNETVNEHDQINTSHYFSDPYTLQFINKETNNLYDNYKLKKMSQSSLTTIAIIGTLYYLIKISTIFIIYSHQTHDTSTLWIEIVGRTIGLFTAVLLWIIRDIHMKMSKNNNYLFYDVLTISTASNACLLLAQISACITLITRLVNGTNCLTNGLHQMTCNPNASCKGMMFGTPIVILLNFFIYKNIYLRADFHYNLLSWCIAFCVFVSGNLYANLNDTGSIICVMFFVLYLFYNHERYQMNNFIEYTNMRIYINESLHNQERNNPERYEGQKYEHDSFIELEKQQLNRVIGNVAHDMKTPLQSLALDLDVLKSIVVNCEDTTSTAITRPLHEIITSMHHTLSYMFIIVNRGVDFCKINSNIELIKRLETFPCETLINDAIKVVNCYNDFERDFLFHSNETITNVISEKTWIFESIVCLISNAVKYSDIGSIEINLDIAKSLNDNNNSNHYDTDITSEYNIKITVQNYTTINTNCMMCKSFDDLCVNGRTHGGTGIGLYVLTHRIAELGGTCDFYVDEKITKFWFEIPIQMADIQIQTLLSDVKQSLPSSSACTVTEQVVPPYRNIFKDDVTQSANPITVLIVDDSQVITKSIRRSLSLLNCEVDVAVDGLAALTILKKKRYTAVLMDIEMPVMGGIEATVRLREWERSSGISDVDRQVIIGMSASTQSEIRRNAIAVGMNEYTDKPFAVNTIYSLICYTSSKNETNSSTSNVVTSTSMNDVVMTYSGDNIV